MMEFLTVGTQLNSKFGPSLYLFYTCDIESRSVFVVISLIYLLYEYTVSHYQKIRTDRDLLARICVMSRPKNQILGELCFHNRYESQKLINFQVSLKKTIQIGSFLQSGAILRKLSTEYVNTS